MTDRFSIVVEAEPAHVGVVRRAVQAWFESVQWPPADVTQLVFAVGEAVNNCVEHAYRGLRAGRVRVELVAEPVGPTQRRACIAVVDAGCWRVEGSGGVRGNGLDLIRTIVETLDIATGDDGTRVTMRSPAVPRSGVAPT